jgi:hypothetical protein
MIFNAIKRLLGTSTPPRIHLVQPKLLNPHLSLMELRIELERLLHTGSAGKLNSEELLRLSKLAAEPGEAYLAWQSRQLSAKRNDAIIEIEIAQYAKAFEDALDSIQKLEHPEASARVLTAWRQLLQLLEEETRRAKRSDMEQFVFEISTRIHRPMDPRKAAMG